MLVSGVLAGRMLLYDGLHGDLRTVKLRPRQQHCVVCGDKPSVTHLVDYSVWCQSCQEGNGLALLDHKDRISCHDYKSVLDSQHSHLLLDVREEGEFEICHLHNATSILHYVTIIQCATALIQTSKLKGTNQWSCRTHTLFTD